MDHIGRASIVVTRYENTAPETQEAKLRALAALREAAHAIASMQPPLWPEMGPNMAARPPPPRAPGGSNLRPKH